MTVSKEVAPWKVTQFEALYLKPKCQAERNGCSNMAIRPSKSGGDWTPRITPNPEAIHIYSHLLEGPG